MHIQGSQADTQAPTRWNLIGRSKTASPPVLSPTSILPPLFITLRFNSYKDIFGTPLESVIIPNLILHFFKNCVRRIPHTATLRYVAECLNATVMVLLTMLNLPSTPHAGNVIPNSVELHSSTRRSPLSGAANDHYHVHQPSHVMGRPEPVESSPFFHTQIIEDQS